MVRTNGEWCNLKTTKCFSLLTFHFLLLTSAEDGAYFH